MAHVFAASDEGPRPNPDLTPQQRGAYENLILLCPTCHVTIDKAPDAYPDALILGWKRSHKQRIADAFGAREYADRDETRAAIEPLLEENHAIFNQYGPHGAHSADPESDVAELWRRKVRARILPNNRKILAILDANRSQLTSEERNVLQRFRQHADDLEARHLGDGLQGGGSRFPSQMATILIGAWKNA
jgi:hypothetical protein